MKFVVFNNTFHQNCLKLCSSKTDVLPWLLWKSLALNSLTFYWEWSVKNTYLCTFFIHFSEFSFHYFNSFIHYFDISLTRTSLMLCSLYSLFVACSHPHFHLCAEYHFPRLWIPKFITFLSCWKPGASQDWRSLR